MNIPRTLGIAIVMIVPTFVGSGALWAIFHHAAPVIIWVLIMIGVLGGIITGKLSKVTLKKA